MSDIYPTFVRCKDRDCTAERVPGTTAQDGSHSHRTHEPRVDVLCGCGWGRLGIPESAVPDSCPLCGHVWVQGEEEE